MRRGTIAAKALTLLLAVGMLSQNMAAYAAEEGGEPTESSVTITYAVEDEDKGSVSVTSETITSVDEIKGSEATANEGYDFSAWKDADGETVGTDATFVPELSELPAEDVTYTAYFVEKEENEGEENQEPIPQPARAPQAPATPNADKIQIQFYTDSVVLADDTDIEAYWDDLKVKSDPDLEPWAPKQVYKADGETVDVKIWTTFMSAEEIADGTVPYCTVSKQRLVLQKVEQVYYEGKGSKNKRTIELWPGNGGADTFNGITITAHSSWGVTSYKDTNKIMLTWGAPSNTESVSYSTDVANITTGDNTYAAEWDAVNNKDGIQDGLPAQTKLSVDKTTRKATIPAYNLSGGIGTITSYYDQYGSGLTWKLSGYKISIDGGEAVEYGVDTTEITVPEGAQSVNVVYCFAVDESAVMGAIEYLNHEVEQDGKALTAGKSGDTDKYEVEDRDGLVVNYSTGMDLTRLGGIMGTNSWDMLVAYKNDIYDTTTVNLDVTFSEWIDLSDVDAVKAAFAGATFESDMFDLDRNDIKVDGQKVTLTCYWNSARAKANDNLSPLIRLSNVPLNIKSDWDGKDAITVTSGGTVKGVVRSRQISYAAINGGSKSDAFILAIKSQEQGPDEEHKEHDGGYGNITLYKVDAQTGQALAGAKIALYKSNGDYVGTYTTGSNGEIEIKNAAYSTYYFQEMQAPEGYVLDNTHQNLVLDKDHPNVTIKFTNTKVEVTPIVVDEPNTDNSEVVADKIDTTTATITTGDDSNMMLYGMLFAAAAAALVAWTRKARAR